MLLVFIVVKCDFMNKNLSIRLNEFPGLNEYAMLMLFSLKYLKYYTIFHLLYFTIHVLNPGDICHSQN